jgi:hypothetical protein
MACVHDSAGRSSQVQGHAETRPTFGFLGWASVLSPEAARYYRYSVVSGRTLAWKNSLGRVSNPEAAVRLRGEEAAGGGRRETRRHG